MHITTLTKSEIERAIKLVKSRRKNEARVKIIKSLGARSRATTGHLEGFGSNNISDIAKRMNKLLEPMGLMIFCEKLPPHNYAWSFFRI